MAKEEENKKNEQKEGWSTAEEQPDAAKGQRTPSAPITIPLDQQTNPDIQPIYLTKQTDESGDGKSAPNTEPSVIHHVVYSVKGGCGKTSFALLLLLSDFIENNKKQLCGPIGSDGNDRIVKYFFDVDFLGTSIISITGDNEETKDSDTKYIKMNDLIFNEADVRDIHTKNTDDTNKRKNVVTDGVYIIPSSMHEKDKERFHVKRKYTPLLRYDEFRSEIEGIVDGIKLSECIRSDDNSWSMANKCVNFIYDMPPNSDGYTEAVFDYLTKRPTKDKVIIYLVFNNYALLKCNLEWMERFIASSKNGKFTWCIVRNDTDAKRVFEKKPDLYENVPDAVRKLVDELLENNGFHYDDILSAYCPYNSIISDFGNSDTPRDLKTLYEDFRGTNKTNEA